MIHALLEPSESRRARMRRQVLRVLWVGGATGLGLVRVAAAQEAVQPAPADAPPVEVFGDTSDGACRAWVDGLRRAGWTVHLQERPAEQMPRVRRWLMVPSDSPSVWLARVGAYFLDGPVPPAVVTRMWRLRPTIRGLVATADGGVREVGHDGLERPLAAF
jgi:hypothetical protein